MRDFTLNTFGLLISALKNRGYHFITVRELSQTYDENQLSNNPICIIRHDVDRLPQNSLATAKLENALGINGTYYFRVVDDSFDQTVIRQIELLGHEIGYHYEDVDLAQIQLTKYEKIIKEDTLLDKAYDLFRTNLQKLQSVARIETICMHGSPLSQYDNKLLWKKYNYKELGITCEPYLDINWNQFGYLTDTGRRWDGDKYSVRDKIKGTPQSQSMISDIQTLNKKYRSTFDIIADINSLPKHIMLTVHPQRWNNNVYLWTAELITQNFKNIIKRLLYVKRY